MSRKYLTLAGVVGFILVVTLASSLFMVRQTEQALVLQFGRPIAVRQDPGLHVKLPFLQNVEYFDKRLLDFNAEPKEVIAADQKRLRVDAFVRYRIIDPLRFKQTVADERTMRSRLNAILESSLRQVVGSVPLSAVISAERGQVMQRIKELVNQAATGNFSGGQAHEETGAHGFGIEVVDVRIKRADLPPENSEGIYRRMQTERDREAKEFRAQGAEEAQRIRSRAERDRTVLLAEAQKKAEILRGEGDSRATKIFADAFSSDQDFYQFYRSLQAYRKSLSAKDTTVILSPDSEFLKHLEGAR